MNNEVGDHSIPEKDWLEGGEEISLPNHAGTSSEDASWTETRKGASGVYCIMNTANGKKYIGSSKNIRARLKLHHKHLMANKHHSYHLQAAWNKYGKDAFLVSILFLCSPSECLANEQRFMDQFQAANHDFGYNIRPTAGSPLGVKLSAENRAKISARMTKWMADPEKRRIQVAILNAYTQSEEGRRARSIHAQRLHKCPLYKAKLHAPRKPLSEETKRKISERHMGRKLSPESIAKMRASLTGKKHSPESKANARRICNSPEHKAKLRAGWVRRKAAKAAKLPFTPSLF